MFSAPSPTSLLAKLYRKPLNSCRPIVIAGLRRSEAGHGRRNRLSHAAARRCSGPWASTTRPSDEVFELNCRFFRRPRWAGRSSPWSGHVAKRSLGHRSRAQHHRGEQGIDRKTRPAMQWSTCSFHEMALHLNIE